MKKILILITLILPSYSQASTYNQDEWIIKLSEYRDYIMRKNPQGTLQLKSLFDKWDKLDVNSKEIYDFTSNVLLSVDTYGNSFKKIKKQIKKYLPDSKIDESFDETDLKILKENGELLNLINIAVLESDYPFKLNRDAEILKELAFYQINPEDRVGDIGAGNGQFSLIINRIYPDVKLAINEVSYLSYKYIGVQIEKSPQLFNKSNIELVHGKRKSSRLEEKQLDKIIIRNTLHHFSHKDEMLQSIKLSMPDKALLFIKETTREMDKDDEICGKAMKNEEIEKILAKNGFILLEKINLSEETIFKYAKKE